MKRPDLFGELLEALIEMVTAHSMANIGVDASMRRLNATKNARLVIAKAQGRA